MEASRRVAFLCSGFNGLTQQVWTALAPRFGASILVVGPQWGRLLDFNPHLVLAPYLNLRIPESVYAQVPCLVFHPGPHGLGGPSSLNWAILEGRKDWAACVFEARQGWDEGPLWAEQRFELPQGSVIQLYRRTIAPQATALYQKAIERFWQGGDPLPRGEFRYQRKLTSADLEVDWSRPAEDLLAVVQAGDSQPGAWGEIEGKRYGLFGARLSTQQGRPGELLGFEESAALVACGKGSLKFGRLMPEGQVKLRANEALNGEG